MFIEHFYGLSLGTIILAGSIQFACIYSQIT